MNANEKIEALKFIIGRFDHYYDSINNKGNLYLTINTFVLGGVIVGYYALNQIYHFNTWVLLLFVITLLANLLSFTCTLSAIKPFAGSYKQVDPSSLLFFMDVSNWHKQEWLQQWEELDENKWQADLMAQTQHLAAGLKKKFNCLTYATWFIGLQVACIILFGIILLTIKIQ